MKLAAKAGPINWPGLEAAQRAEGIGAVAAFCPVARRPTSSSPLTKSLAGQDRHRGEHLVGQVVEAGVEDGDHHALAVEAEVVHRRAP
jgi:hypothetical protein